MQITKLKRNVENKIGQFLCACNTSFSSESAVLLICVCFFGCYVCAMFG